MNVLRNLKSATRKVKHSAKSAAKYVAATDIVNDVVDSRAASAARTAGAFVAAPFVAAKMVYELDHQHHSKQGAERKIAKLQAQINKLTEEKDHD